LRVAENAGASRGFPQGDQAETRNCYGCGEKGHLRANCPYPSDRVELRHLAEQHQAELIEGRWCFSIAAEVEPEEEKEDRSGYTTEGLSDSDSTRS
jgi:hypothetical protein